ncbi:MAG: SsrA-binding protein SmpB [Candidatus Paceibacterota bacterium]
MSTLVSNKKIARDYEILETYQAGIELKGFEVKSVKASQGSLDGAYISIRGSEAFLVNATIPAFQPANAPQDYDPERPRKLLLHKREIKELSEREKEGGLTIVPLKLYTKTRFVKIELALVRGKKKHDKRETIKRKDMQRDTERSFKKRFR